MAKAVQIVVAAGLIGAWMWVLGRPFVRGVLQKSGRGRSGSSLDGSARSSALFGLDWLGWHRSPVVARRRQLLLATMFATFASFLLAVALRGQFVWLFALMTVALAVHLAVASYLGGRIVAARERHASGSVGAKGRRRAGPSASMTIRATRIHYDRDVGLGDLSLRDLSRHDLNVNDLSDLSLGHLAVNDLTLDDLVSSEPERADGLLDATNTGERVLSDSVLSDSVLSDSVRVSINRVTAEAYVSPLAGGEQAVTSFVEELIELEWGSAHEQVGEPTLPGLPETTLPHTETPVVEDPADTPGSVEGGSEADAIFTRPTGPASPRPRRKPRPIYIHSQLDEDGFDPPRAVNHP